ARAGMGRGGAGWALAGSCFGVLVVALGYAAGRLGIPGGMVAYWVGQALVFVPVAWRVLSRRLGGSGEALTLVLGLAVNQYLLKWAYSPDQFRFADELQHWAATTNLLRTGHLFQVNHALPVSAYFPGLEEMGAAIASMTGLPVTAAGFLLAGVLHLLLVAILFMLVSRTGGSARLAALSCLVYATGLHYLFFDSMYGYQTAALPFLLLAVWAARQTGWAVLVVGVVAVLVTTVSHHVSALILAGMLVALAVAEIVLRGRRRVATAVLAATAALAVAAWFWFAAHPVLSYLAIPVHGMTAAITRLLTGGEAASASASGGSPLWSLAVQAASLLALLVLFLVAAWRAVRRRPRLRGPWRWCLLLGALAFFAGSGLRFLGTQGPELAGRAATFTYLPMSIVAAGVLLDWRPRLSWRPLAWPPLRRLARLVPGGLLVLSLLLVAARVGGWPPAFELLPGRYLVSGYERGVDPLGVAAATWTRTALGTGNRVAADVNGYTLVSTYGGQDPVGEAAALYDDEEWGLSDELVLQNYAVSYLWADSRITEQAPASGALFPVDPQAGRRTAPLAASKLSKVDQLSAADRVYDNGTIRIYNMTNA
ncbi:MAG TPA: hypothetical protein VJT31_03780, partial [Rugosimonospora sp.]|nr:hypothetical protein [Rugosimonospora sp.]